MRTAPVLLLLCAAAFAQERDLRPESRAFLEVAASHQTCFAQEAVRVRLSVGVDRAFFAEHAVPLFSREMDLDLHVRAPWLEALDRTVILPAATEDPPDDRTLTFALNDEVVEAARAEDRLIDGRRYAVLAIERTYLPLRPGVLVVEEPTLVFAYSESFEPDMLVGRRPKERRMAVVTGEPLRIDVWPLPEEGRPAEFTGAVGRFSVEARTEARDVTVGESFRLLLFVEGEGNLAFFAAPRLSGLDGFHVYGRIDDKATPRRTITYDLTPTDAARAELPAIPFAFFDPGPPARYRVARTEPIPLTVRPSASAPSPPAPEPEAPSEDAAGSWVILGAALVGASLVAAGLLALRRARRRARPDPERERARSAAAAFRKHVGRAGADPGPALAEFLAALLRCPAAAVISPALAARLGAAGMPGDLAARATTLLEDLVGARYGGGSAGDAASAAGAVVEEIAAAWGDSP